MNNGIYFIERHYKDLYKIIKDKRTSNNINKYEDINDYFYRIDRISSKAINNGKKDLLYKAYYKKYITTSDEKVRSIQEKSLKPWLDYLTREDFMTPFWVKYFVFQGMVKIGGFNKEKNTFNKRRSNTTCPFIELNVNVLDKLINYLISYVNGEKIDNDIYELLNKGGFTNLYLYLLNDYKSKENNDTKGKWIKYNHGNKTDAYKMFESVKDRNTFWCIKDLNCSIDSIMGSDKYKAGDFYIYYTLDENKDYKVPRIAIKHTKTDGIHEIRGVNDSYQNIEPSMLSVLEKKLEKLDGLTDLDRKYYLKTISDYRELIKLTNKTKNKIALEKDELDFIYEINDFIYIFGNQYDQRINYIREHNIIKDKYFLLKASIRVEDVLKYASVELKNDMDVVSDVIGTKYYLLYLVGEKLKNNKEFMLPIIKKDAFFVRYASNELKKDKEIALIVLKSNLEYFRHMNLNLLKDEDFVREASNIKGFSKKYILNQ